MQRLLSNRPVTHGAIAWQEGRNSSPLLTKHRLAAGLAIALALVFGWLLLIPALINPADSNLPACCRRDGKHHCMQSQTGNHGVTLRGRCSQFPGIAVVSHSSGLAPASYQAIFAGLVNHPSVRPQLEAGYRAAHLRSKQKRGPPFSVIS